MCGIKTTMTVGSLRFYEIKPRKGCSYLPKEVAVKVFADKSSDKILKRHARNSIIGTKPVELVDYGEKAKLAWSDWLGKRPTHGLDFKPLNDSYMFCTFTFRDTDMGVPTQGYAKRRTKWFANAVHKVAPDIAKMFFVQERGSENDRVHYHGLFYVPHGRLVGGMPEIIEDVAGKWHHGFSRVEEEYATSGAYVGKYLTKDENDQEILHYDFSE